MSRFRVVMGLLAVAVGTAWWSGDLALAWASVVGAAPYVVVAVAVVGGVRSFVPRGVLLGPAMLLAIGLIWLLIRFDVIGSVGLRTMAAGTLVFGGFVVALTSGRGGTEPVAVRRFRALAWPRCPRPEGTMPWKMSAVGVLTRLSIDLSDMAFPSGFPVVEVDVTVFAGRVDLVIPKGWAVALGRVHRMAVHPDGELDLPHPVRYAADLVDKKPARKWVMINLLGLAGSVTLTKRKR